MYEIRVCVTLKCNYRCIYCSKDGEGIFSNNPELTEEEILKIVENMTSIGINSVRLTGGEPFMRRGLINLAHKVKRINGIDKLSIVTNGAMINDEIIEQLSNNNPFDYMSVSLDTMDPIKYKCITQRDCFNIVKNNILALSKCGVKVRINYVLTSDNVGEAEQLIDFCLQEKVDLKILDLYNNNSKFVEASVIEKIVRMKGLTFDREEMLPGNLGTPMAIYSGNGIEVIVKNSYKGTVYSQVACEKCPKYPCQLGVVGPIMTHDGIVKVCNLGREKGVNCFDAYDLKNIKRVLNDAQNLSQEWVCGNKDILMNS